MPRRFSALALFLIASFLAACVSTPTQLISSTPTIQTSAEPRTPPPTVTASPPSNPQTTEPPNHPTSQPPSPTIPASLHIGLLAPGSEAADSSPPALVGTSLQSLANENGWTVETGGRTDLVNLIQHGAQIIVTVGTGLPIQTIAIRYPDTQFVLVDEQPLTLVLPNVVIVGGEGSREDQAAFLAGVQAGLTTQIFSVGVLADTDSAIGRKYLNGFIHGVRFSCPECDITDQALAAEAPQPDAEAAARRLFNRATFDVAFAQPGASGDTALRWLAQQDIFVIGSGGDLLTRAFDSGSAPGSDKVLGSVHLRPDLLLRQLLPALATGQRVESPISYSLASGTIALLPGATDPLSPASHAFIEQAIARLITGELDTGVDPATGEER